MNEERKLENTELDDETLGEVSGGGTAKFTCNGCSKEVVFDYSEQVGKVVCSNCKAAYLIEPRIYRVTEIKTYKGVADLRWR